VISDHADWPDLIRTIRETGARRVLATHGSTETLAAYVRECMGLDSQPLEMADGAYGAEE
jgi:putative mRNA 3-end processing factor